VRGEQHHRQLVILAHERTQQSDAVELRHAQIRDHGVERARRRGADAGERGLAIGLGVDLEALLLQQCAEHLAEVGLVVDEQDAGAMGAHVLRTSAVGVTAMAALGSTLAGTGSAGVESSSRAGNNTVKRAPTSVLFATSMTPW